MSQLFLSDDRLKEKDSEMMCLRNYIIQLETEKKKENVHSGNRFCILNCIWAVFFYNISFSNPCVTLCSDYFISHVC